MTTYFSEVIRGWLGWCPNSRVVSARAPMMRDGNGLAGSPGPQGLKPESATGGTMNVPDWLTAVSIIVLFATLFVGGNFWWPILVFIIIVIGIADMYRLNRSSREA